MNTAQCCPWSVTIATTSSGLASGLILPKGLSYDLSVEYPGIFSGEGCGYVIVENNILTGYIPKMSCDDKVSISFQLPYSVGFICPCSN